MPEQVLTPFLLLVVILPAFWALTNPAFGLRPAPLVIMGVIFALAASGLYSLATQSVDIDPVLALIAILCLALAGLLTIVALVRWLGRPGPRIALAGGIALAIGTLPFIFRN